MRLFLDSSVVAKLFIEEKESDDAIKLMKLSGTKGVEIKAAQLSIYEVGNAIKKNLGKKSKDTSEFMMQLFLLNIDYVHLDSDLAALAMEMAVKYGVSYYDAVHLALCREDKGILVTEDKLILKKDDMAMNIKETLKMLEKR
jgi:predicted nucleic acid-binding protein